MGPVEDAAAACLEEGCSVDTIADLLNELKTEANAMGNVAGDRGMSARQREILLTIDQLSVLSPEVSKPEIEKIVASAARSFQVVEDFEFKGPAIGYTGKVGTTTTAGESLDE